MSNHDSGVLLEEEETQVEDAGFGGAFDAEETSINSALQIKSNITIKQGTISIDDIITSNFKKIGRTDSLIGLSGVVGEWGVVTPIHVLKMEDDDMFMILDGLRRVFGALRSGKTEIPAMIWDFDDKQEGKEKANLISLMINRSQRFTAKEMWEQLKILEEVNDASPGLIEFLLQMQSGDAMKLKDVMLSDMEYSEIRNDLMDGITTIDSAYRKLCNERRKENRLAKEDATVLEGSGSDPEDMDDNQHLSVDAVKDLLDLTSLDVDGESLEDLDRSSEAIGEHNVQEVGNRKPIDPRIKQETFIRDDFKCRCCGKGAPQWLGILVYHHLIPVFLGGEDSINNGLTICTGCHITLHLYSFGKVNVNFKELNEEEQKIFKNIFKFGNIIIEAMKRTKISRDVAYKEDSSSRRHLYPGEGLKQNTEMFNKAQNN